MEILQPYNNDTLQLISDSSDYILTDEILSSGDIKISVFDDSGIFNISDDLLQDTDYYINNDELFLKPNGYLDRNGFSEGNYNIQFDFLNRLGLNSQIPISQISPSRKEIRLSLIGQEIPLDMQNLISQFLNGNPLPSSVDSLDEYSSYQFNSFLELSQGRLIPINGYTFDEVTDNKRTLILKLNELLPTDIQTLSTDFKIANKFLSSQTETIFFIDRDEIAVSGLGLEVDVATLDDINPSNSSYDNFNEITESVGPNIVDEVNRLQKDLNLNIDYEKFNGHVFFGSAKSKLENFKNKVVKLDGLYSQVSSSLSMVSNAQVVEKRKDLFREIRDVKNDFTHYEYFMYNDGQSYSTSSAPGVGNNFAGRDYTNKFDNTLTILTGSSSEGFDKIYKKSEDGFIHLFTDVYNVENAPFYNSNDDFYLSFILKGGGDNEGEYGLNISGGLANQTYNTTGGTTLGDYPYVNDRQIPFDAWSGSVILNSEVTGSEYRRFIFRAQQNYFRPSDLNGITINGGESYKKDSTNWTIATGSMVSELITDGTGANLIDSTGKFANYFFPSNFNEDGLVDSNATRPTIILPQGDLFPVFSHESGDKEAFFTDVVVTKNNPTNILPFSKTYRPPNGTYAGSSEWNTWYDALYDIASDYDDNNIHSLVNNLPEILQTGTQHKVLRNFVNMLAEQFDLLRSYIDNYHNIYKLGYKNPNAMPDNLLPIIGNSLGFNLQNPLSGSLENYLESTGGDEVGDKKAVASLWTKILNNLMYIYKTKGTHESLNTLLNLYGYDTNSFNLTEYGGSTDEHNPSVVTNNVANDLDNGLKNVKGNVSFIEKTEQLKSLNLSSGSNSLALDWWTGDAKPNGIEFILRTTPTNNIQTITRASGSADLWDLRIIPSGSSTTTGSLEFRLNNSFTGSLAIASNAISMSTSYINDINNFKYFNVMLQKNVVSVSAQLTQSYHLFVGRADGDKIKDIQFTSTSSFDTNTNLNFITASAAQNSEGNNLFFGESISGSIAEIRGWDAYVSMSKFKQHILNYKSVVGGKVTSARDSLVYHYPLSDNESSTKIKDISSPSKVKNFDKTVSAQPKLNQIKTSISTVKNFSFQVRGTDAVKSDKQYKIGSNLKSVGGLNSKAATLKQPVKPGTNESKVKVINKIGKTYSYVDAIDSIVINAMADFEIDDYLDDYDNNGIYDDLLTLRKQLIEERLVSVDVVKNLTAVEKHTDNPKLVETLESMTPAKTKFEFSYEVKNDTLFRSKIKKASLQTELNPNKVIGSASLSEPVLSVKFNENKHEKNINVLTDEVSISSLLNENLKEKTINVLEDEVGITSIFNDKVHTNESTPLDVVDLSKSKNQTIFNIEPDNFTDLLLGSKNEFYKNSGIGINKTFFKSGNPGNDGNYNTYKYEDRFFFRSIGDTEEFFPVSASYKNRTGTNAKQPFNHHDNFRHFGNRYYVDSGSGYTYNSFFGGANATINARMVGRTLFFKSDSSGNITYPINHYFKVGTSKDALTNLIYKGTQNNGSNPPQFDKSLDTSPTISAYTINVGGSDTKKKLKVIR